VSLSAREFDRSLSAWTRQMSPQHSAERLGTLTPFYRTLKGKLFVAMICCTGAAARTGRTSLALRNFY